MRMTSGTLTTLVLLGIVSTSLTLMTGCPEEVSFVPSGGEFANGCDAQPVLNLLRPANDSEVGNEIDMLLEVGNFRIVDKLGQPNGPCEGHLHIFLDEEVLEVTPETELVLDVASFSMGPHTFRVELHNNDHSIVPDVVPVEVEVFKTTPAEPN